jgi:hypothetical protein
MSTNLRQLSELDTLTPNDFRPVAALPRPTREMSAARLRHRFQDLGIVIERLFAFYEAMRTGKPLANCDEMLAQVGGVLTRSTGDRNHG